MCKCEKVTEAEVIDACHRSLPVDSTQAMRKRVRAGMGHCQVPPPPARLPRSLLSSRPDVLRRFCLQGDPENYGCEARVAAIIARETGTPLAAVGRRPWPATTLLPRRWPSKEDKQALVATAEGE